MELTEHSKNMIHYFMKTYGLKTIPKMKEKTAKVLQKIYDDMRSADSFLRSLKSKTKRIYQLKTSKISRVSQIPWPHTFQKSAFPTEIKKHIEERSHTLLNYTLSLLGMKIQIKIVVEDTEANIPIETYNNYVDQMIMWLYIANDYARSECVKNLNIFMYFTSLPKTLPSSTIDILGENHVNTAFTYSCPVGQDSEIIIFRKEEWFKVFIHETFHNLGLDFSEMMRSLHKANKDILSMFKVNIPEVNLFEAYTEVWAEIMNASFCAYHILSDKQDKNEFIRDIHFLITMEQHHKMFQMVKILKFMGLTYKQLYSDSKMAIGMRETLYKEKSSILSYYVISSVLMNNYEDFLIWCDQNNLSLLQFKKTTGNVDKFVTFIQKHYKTKNMLDNVKKSEELVNKLHIDSENKNKTNTNDGLLFLMNNTRMSLCEMK